MSSISRSRAVERARETESELQATDGHRDALLVRGPTTQDGHGGGLRGQHRTECFPSLRIASRGLQAQRLKEEWRFLNLYTTSSSDKPNI